MKDYLHNSLPVHFVFPIDGDCLNKYDGEEKNNTLWINVRISAPEGMQLILNDTYKAEFKDGEYIAQVPIYSYRTNLVVSDCESGEIYDKIVVLKLSNPTEGFRFSVDDNIIFLKDINDNAESYKSIFDNEYLAIYKEAHDKYGAKVQLNIHYETDCYAGFSNKRDYFCLDMMTNKFKEEWESNSDWLRLSFHARTVMPDEPYKTTDMNRIFTDASAVYEQVTRFAGEKTLCKENTTIHWGECTLAGVRALKNLGLSGAYGYFDFKGNGEPAVSYFYPHDLVEHIHGRDFWYDTEEDVLYGKIDLVLNRYTHEQIIPLLNEIYEKPHISGFIDLMIHEQYYYDDYANYKAEFKDMILSSCKWAYNRGYIGRFLDEVK